MCMHMLHMHMYMCMYMCMQPAAYTLATKDAVA